MGRNVKYIIQQIAFRFKYDEKNSEASPKFVPTMTPTTPLLIVECIEKTHILFASVQMLIIVRNI
jgi:hypothetical protein